MRISLTKGAIPNPLIFPKECLLTIPTKHLTQGERRDLERDVLPVSMMCAFNPFRHPLEGSKVMLTYNDPVPQRFGLKGKMPKPLSQ
uniref:Uncharacterized protein n=1 Tax=Cucumis melo TaxID=3656 RepID=A0A9I9E9M8_CUCME